MQALAVLLGLFLVAFAGIALFNDNPLRRRAGRAHRLAQDAGADDKAATAAAGHAEPADEIRAQAGRAGENKTVTIIDGSSGKRQDVVIGGDAAATRPMRKPRPRR